MYQDTTNLFNTTLTREAGSLLHEEFALNCYVKLPLFFNDDSFAILKAEVLRIFEQHSRRRDFNMKHEQNTPRHLDSFGNYRCRNSPMITAVVPRFSTH